jgi:putative ABC transport system permease protein
MRTGDVLGVGWRALRANGGRSLLTTLGIIIGVAAVIATMSIGAGAEDEVAETLRTLGSNLLLVAPGAPQAHGVRLEAGARRNLTEGDAEAIGRELPEVRIAAPLVSRRLQVIAAGRNWSTTIAGTTPAYLAAREWSMADGRTFDAADLSAGARVAIVGADVAMALFDEKPAVGERMRIGNAPAIIIAVLARKGTGAAGHSQDDVVFVPLTMAKSRLLGEEGGVRRDALDFISVKLTDEADISAATGAIEALLRRRHRLQAEAQNDFTVSNPADVLAARAGATRTLAWLLFGAASVSLAVGGISVMNIMLVSVGERTREFGLRLAVGARRRDLIQQLLVETVVLALAGGLIGSVVGIAATYWIAWQANWRVLISPLSVLLAWGLAGFTGIIFGLYPAYRASRLDPIEALRHE